MRLVDGDDLFIRVDEYIGTRSVSEPDPLYIRDELIAKQPTIEPAITVKDLVDIILDCNDYKFKIYEPYQHECYEYCNHHVIPDEIKSRDIDRIAFLPCDGKDNKNAIMLCLKSDDKNKRAILDNLINFVGNRYDDLNLSTVEIGDSNGTEYFIKVKFPK